MGIKRNPERTGDARGLWKLWTTEVIEPEPIPRSLAKLVPTGMFRYRALEDPLFRDTWKAEPAGYTGRGIIYLFHGRGARQEAQAKAAEINQRDGFV
jgi:hypothetical protein